MLCDSVLKNLSQWNQGLIALVKNTFALGLALRAKYLNNLNDLHGFRVVRHSYRKRTFF